MKPEWKDAPDWANWLAMDGDGLWFWHENKPEWDELYKEWFITEQEPLGQADCCNGIPDCDGIDWDFAYEAIEARP